MDKVCRILSYVAKVGAAVALVGEVGLKITSLFKD